MRTTRARDRPGSKLWPSTGEGLCPVPHLYDNATAVDGSSCFVPVPHLYDNAMAIDGSSHFVPVPKLGKNEDYQGEGSPW